MKETNRIELKRELTDDLEKEVVAFLNYHEGGKIYIGIDDDGTAVGVSNSDDLMLRIKDRLRTNISPSCLGLFDVLHETHDSKDVVVVTIASGSEKPYYLKKKGMSESGCFMRVGTAAEPMSTRQIEELFAKRTRNSLNKIKSIRQNLSFEQLKIYYNEKGLTLSERFKESLELLTEDGSLNYVSYLLADENGTSIKLAKYTGTDRVDLAENNEYGYCSLIKATKSVLDKLEIENKTVSKITPQGRIDTRLWDAIALREAVVNAIVHNDYTREVPPKFELFDDRLEITSYGGLCEGMTQSDFFGGLSCPRNKELIRIYKDLGMVEQLGSGVPRILKAYSKASFSFGDSFLRITLPKSVVESNQVGNQVEGIKLGYLTSELVKHLNTIMPEPISEKRVEKYTELANKLSVEQFKVLEYTSSPKKKKEILEDCLGISNQTKNYKKHIEPLIQLGLLQYTILDRIKSQHQKYVLTSGGKAVLYIKSNIAE